MVALHFALLVLAPAMSPTSARVMAVVTISYGSSSRSLMRAAGSAGQTGQTGTGSSHRCRGRKSRGRLAERVTRRDMSRYLGGPMNVTVVPDSLTCLTDPESRGC